jgi:DNA-binding transcriptional LysR family regulator
MLDIQMKIFKTVVDKSSFSLAAQELHMTQSSVSQQIHNLESYYGVRLFDRLHRRITLTQAGSALYPYAVQLESICNDARKTVQGLMDDISGHLHIGASLTVGEYWLPKTLLAFSRLFPKVHISMDIFNTEQITAMVLAGKINLGFVEGPFDKPDVLVTKTCGGDQLVVITSRDYPLPPGKRTSLSELLLERWVMREPTSGTRRVFEEFLDLHKYDPAALNIVMELGSTQAIKEAVKAGLGIATISRLAVVDEVKWGKLGVIPLSEGPMERPYTIMYHREKFKTSAVEKFYDFVINNNCPDLPDSI